MLRTSQRSSPRRSQRIRRREEGGRRGRFCRGSQTLPGRVAPGAGLLSGPQRPWHTVYEKGDLQAAEREFRQVIAEDPNSTQAYFNLGNVLFLTNRNGEAKQTLEAGLRLSPSNALGHYLSGSVLTRLGDFKAAEEQLKTARVLNPRCRKWRSRWPRCICRVEGSTRPRRCSSIPEAIS